MSYEKQMRIANEVVEQNAFDPSELFFLAHDETARKQSDRQKGNESELFRVCLMCEPASHASHASHSASHASQASQDASHDFNARKCF